MVQETVSEVARRSADVIGNEASVGIEVSESVATNGVLWYKASYVCSVQCVCFHHVLPSSAAVTGRRDRFQRIQASTISGPQNMNSSASAVDGFLVFSKE